MNKARRQELKNLKYKKRLKLLKAPAECLKNPKAVVNGISHNYTGFKSSSKPCSCCMCRNAKYQRAKVNKSEDGRGAIKRLAGLEETLW